MALTKVSRGLLSTSIVDNGNATAITIDSSQNVGIGVSPSSEFHVKGDANTIARIEPNNNSGKATLLVSSTASGDGGIQYDANNNQTNLFSYSDMTFNVGTGNLSGGYPANERMRISGGTLLVGKPATGIATVGAELKATGELLATVNSDACAFLNRKTSDGDIAVFRKDNTTVGSIGTSGGKLDIDGPANNSGLRFHESSLIPKKNDGVTNGEVDLGYNDGSTILGFRNLTLSGGVYLGGTGAANKLDDYEEGTWTLAITTVNGGESVGIGNTLGSYTKIGKQVTATIYTAAINISAAGSGSVRLGGLPFTCSGGNHSYAVPSFGHTNCFSYEVDGYVAINSNFIVPTRVSTVTSNALTVANPVYMMFTLTYFTDQ
jgi:hypothetical protein